MTRNQSILLSLKQILDDGCLAMSYQSYKAANYKVRVAQNVLSGITPALVEDYDLDNGIIYLAGETAAVEISSLPEEQAFAVLRATIDKSVQALDKDQGLAAGQMLRYAQRIASTATRR